MSRPHPRNAVIACLLWFAGWLGIGWLDVELRNLSIFVVFVLMGYGGGGILLLGWLGQLVWERERRLKNRVIMAVTVLAAFPLIFAVCRDSLGATQITRYRWEARRREPVIARLQEMPPATRQNTESAAHIEIGQTRVAEGTPSASPFPIARGFICNWYALVYDPTGQIARQREASTKNGVATIPSSRLYVFGYRPLSVKPLGNSWYFCLFDGDRKR